MSIREHLNKIRNAIYGREVRESIAKGIETAYDDASENGNANMEVKIARGTHPNLRSRLEEVDNKQQQTATQLAQTQKEKISHGEVSVYDIDKNKGKFDQTFMSDKLLQQMAGDTPIYAIPEDGSLTTRKFADKAVSPKKTNFIKVSGNLFDVYDVIKGYVYPINSGVPVENEVYYIQNSIPVRSNQEMTMLQILRITFFDEGGNFIGQISSPDVNEPFTFSTLEGSFSASVSVREEFMQTAQLNVGSELLPNESFKPYFDRSKVDFGEKSVAIKHLDFVRQTSTNLLNEKAMTPGTLDEETGKVVDSPSNSVSDFISLGGLSSVTLKTANTYKVSFYNDVDSNHIHQIYHHNVPDGVLTITPADLPIEAREARYMRTVVYKDYYGMAQINEGNTLLPYEQYHLPTLQGVTVESPKIEEEEIVDKVFHVDTDVSANFHTDEIFPDYTDSWGDIQSDDVYAMFDELQTQYPRILRKQPLKPDPTGLEVSAYHFSPERPVGDNRVLPKLFITTGTHGYEHASTLNMYFLIKNMCEKWQENESIEFLRFNTELIIIPIVNPYGWNIYQRKNSNGVDINRNFPDDWVLGSDPDRHIYGGPSPLSEIESQNIKQIFDENPDIDVYYDYHNFNGHPENYFIWLASASPEARKLSSSLIPKMSRKWEQEFAFIPNDTFIGYTSVMTEGTVHNYAYKTLGIKRSGTFETCDNVLWDSEGQKFDQNTLKMGVEGITNFLLMNIKDLV